MRKSTQVAKLIKAELKNYYPKMKFSVRSEVFAGGDAVRINYTITDATNPQETAVQEAVAKFQAGYFDGSEDLYVYNKTKTPTVKYITVSANASPLMEANKDVLVARYNLKEFTDEETIKVLGEHKEVALNKFVRKFIMNTDSKRHDPFMTDE